MLKPKLITSRRALPTPQMTGLLFAAGLLTGYQIFLVYTLIPSYNGVPKNDLNLFLMFGRLVLSGQTPYQGDLPFIYQFWVSFFYLPFAPLEHLTALQVWATANLILLFGAVILAWQTFLPALGRLWLLPLYCLTLAVCSNAIITGHTTILTLTALVGSALLIKKQNYFWAGLPLFVLLIKPQITFLVGLGLIILPFIVEPKLKPKIWQYIFGAIVGTIIINVVSLLVQPTWPLQYAHTFNVAQTQGELQPDGTYIEYYKSIFPSWLQLLTPIEQPLLGIFSVVVAGLLLGFGGFRLWQCRNQPKTYLAIAIALNLAITPYSHIYDFPPLILALFVLLENIRQTWPTRPALIRLTLLGLLFAVQPLSADYRWFYTQPFGLALLVLSLKNYDKSISD